MPWIIRVANRLHGRSSSTLISKARIKCIFPARKSPVSGRGEASRCNTRTQHWRLPAAEPNVPNRPYFVRLAHLRKLVGWQQEERCASSQTYPSTIKLSKLTLLSCNLQEVLRWGGNARPRYSDIQLLQRRMRSGRIQLADTHRVAAAASPFRCAACIKKKALRP